MQPPSATPLNKYKLWGGGNQQHSKNMCAFLQYPYIQHSVVTFTGVLASVLINNYSQEIGYFSMHSKAIIMPLKSLRGPF